jgi:predicted metal-dependent peptidase
MGYDIASLKRKMLVKYPFFGSVVTNVSYKENKEIPTAGTDGKTIYYNPEFLGGLSVEEQTFVFAHEVCHIAFNHILRSDGKDPQLWNIATDAVINSLLEKNGRVDKEYVATRKNAYYAHIIYSNEKYLKDTLQNSL